MVAHDIAGDGVDHRLGPRRHGGGDGGAPTLKRVPPRARAARRRSSCSTTPTWPPPPRASPSPGYFNAGQDCTAADPGDRRPGGLRRLRRRAHRAGQGRPKTGAPDDEDVLYGPLNNANQLARVAGFVDRLPDHAEVAAGRRTGRRRRLLLRADRRRRPATGRRDDPERDLRAGHHRPALHRRGRGGALGQRRRVRPGVDRCGRRTTAGRCAWPSGSTSAACGSTPTSRSSPRCPTAASRSRATARTCRCTRLEDYTRIKHVMSNLE